MHSIENTIPADYAYLYDYNSKIYTVLALGDGGAGRRSAHCGKFLNLVDVYLSNRPFSPF